MSSLMVALFVIGAWLFLCWAASQDWNSLSLLQTRCKASATTYDGELSRNSAYFVRFVRASSSSRSWIGVVFGCLVGAFRTAIVIPSSCCSGLFSLCIQVRLLLCMHAGKTRSRFLRDGRERPQRTLGG